MRAAQLKLDLIADAAFLAGSFTLTRPSELGALDEAEGGTVFQVRTARGTAPLTRAQA